MTFLAAALAIALVSTVTPDMSLAGTRWIPNFASNNEAAAEKMFVQFADDGSIYGNGGCNRFFGAYAATGTDFTIGLLGRTRMACRGVMDTENTFIQTLQAVRKFQRSGNELIFYDAAGQEILDFDLSGAIATPNAIKRSA